MNSLTKLVSGKIKKGLLTPLFAFAGFTIICLSSCNTYKNVPYFQNIPSDSNTAVYKNGIEISSVSPTSLKIQPNDILNITIQTIDPELNDMMNPTKNATGGGSTLPINVTGNNANIQGYLVDNDGMIELPLAGKIKVAGLSTEEIKEVIRVKALQFYKQPVVNVRLVNFKVSVIGDVMKPGAYLINGEKASILDAISEAGDLTIFGQRKNVLLSRNENGKQKIVRFDLTSTDIYDSPYFYLKQGDVIYVQPTKSKAASTDGAAIRTYAIITSTLSLVVILVTRNY